MTTQFQLQDPPTDGISCVRYNYAPSKGHLLLVTSWDKTVRVYNTSENIPMNVFEHDAAVLDGCWSPDGMSIASASVDTSVRVHDITTNTSQVLGKHDSGVRCVEWAETIGAVISAGWDKKLKVWDPRINAKTEASVSSHSLGGKAFAMSLGSNRLVVGMNDRQVWIYDVRNMDVVEQQRESALRFQTRCIRSYPNGTGYALSSIEGRVAMEYFDPSPQGQSKKYAFKCHRAPKPGGGSYVYPVNAIAFHPIFGTFATGGSDGTICTWDGDNKKRLQQFKQTFPAGVSSMDFSHDGAYLAISASYTFEEGERDHPPDSIHIRSVADQEVKPRARKPKA